MQADNWSATHPTCHATRRFAPSWTGSSPVFVPVGSSWMMGNRAEPLACLSRPVATGCSRKPFSQPARHLAQRLIALRYRSGHRHERMHLAGKFDQFDRHASLAQQLAVNPPVIP